MQNNISGTASFTATAASNASFASAICLMARLHQVAADPAHLAHQLAWSPASALVRGTAGGMHAVILAQCDGQRVLIQAPPQDPTSSRTGGRPVIEPVAEGWTGELILVTSRASMYSDLAKFDCSWFIPSLVKYRALFSEVLLVSLFPQLFELVSPLFFQVVMDKALVRRSSRWRQVIDHLLPTLHCAVGKSLKERWK